MAAPPLDRGASQAPSWQLTTRHCGLQAADAPRAVLPPRPPPHAPALIDGHNIQRLMLSREQLLAAVPLERALKDGGLSLLQGLVVRFKRNEQLMVRPEHVSAAQPWTPQGQPSDGELTELAHWRQGAEAAAWTVAEMAGQRWQQRLAASWPGKLQKSGAVGVPPMAVAQLAAELGDTQTPLGYHESIGTQQCMQLQQHQSAQQQHSTQQQQQTGKHYAGCSQIAACPPAAALSPTAQPQLRAPQPVAAAIQTELRQPCNCQPCDPRLQWRRTSASQAKQQQSLTHEVSCVTASSSPLPAAAPSAESSQTQAQALQFHAPPAARGLAVVQQQQQQQQQPHASVDLAAVGGDSSTPQLRQSQADHPALRSPQQQEPPTTVPPPQRPLQVRQRQPMSAPTPIRQQQQQPWLLDLLRDSEDEEEEGQAQEQQALPPVSDQCAAAAGAPPAVPGPGLQILLAAATQSGCKLAAAVSAQLGAQQASRQMLRAAPGPGQQEVHLGLRFEGYEDSEGAGSTLPVKGRWWWPTGTVPSSGGGDLLQPGCILCLAEECQGGALAAAVQAWSGGGGPCCLLRPAAPDDDAAAMFEGVVGMLAAKSCGYLLPDPLAADDGCIPPPPALLAAPLCAVREQLEAMTEQQGWQGMGQRLHARSLLSQLEHHAAAEAAATVQDQQPLLVLDLRKVVGQYPDAHLAGQPQILKPQPAPPPRPRVKLPPQTLTQLEVTLQNKGPSSTPVPGRKRGRSRGRGRGRGRGSRVHRGRSPSSSSRSSSRSSSEG
ncbi:hypothetical protein ACK3TF_004805 [Chlorella vulgaris]